MGTTKHLLPLLITEDAVMIPFDLFEFLRMPFGLKNAAQTFQRLMDQICHGREEFLFAYLDDVLIANSDAREHCRHLLQETGRTWPSC